MSLSNLFRLAVAAAFTVCVFAHAKRSPEEMIEHHQQVARGTEILTQCLGSPAMKQLNARIIAKRQESLTYLRRARDINIKPRITDLPEDIPARNKWHAINHDKSSKFQDKTKEQIKNDEELFEFKWKDNPSKPRSSTCILTPENVWGPYWTKRAPYRQDIREDQKGVYMRLAFQVVNIATCAPLQGARVDIWQANATGTYAKQVKDDTKKDVHWLTGAQSTSSWGTADFDTIFPGHYYGRAVHTHVAIRPKQKFNDPKGFVHTGQIFYDEYPRQQINVSYSSLLAITIIDRLQLMDPYSRNHEIVVDNLRDAYTANGATDTYDPFAQWAWLDDHNHGDGLIAWITIGVNLTTTIVSGYPDGFPEG
ncbi:hypothetical protein N0V90_008478 [Kalmusia sp. IMI 367209]|nr:hypothetical protein N0V90_008478 [Kalmusia sp. IMI 367209]